MSQPTTVHASAVLLGETGLLIRGPSGGGKSSLLLALLWSSRNARLVADDRVALAVASGRLIASAPAPIAGLIEIRGHGILHWPHVSPVVIRVVVDLMPPEQCPRLPEPGEAIVRVEGVDLRRIILPGGAADGALRVRAILAGLPP
jgi:serine kinase of HPr protein (carbohydrate metabolism regulator)